MVTGNGMKRNRRKASECRHFFVSSFNGDKMCGGTETVTIGGSKVRIHMTQKCTGVCKAYERRVSE